LTIYFYIIFIKKSNINTIIIFIYLMAKCPCMQAIWEIDNALEEEIQLEEG